MRRLGIGYGRLKKENKYLKSKIKELEFEKNLLKNHNEQLLKQLNR